MENQIVEYDGEIIYGKIELEFTKLVDALVAPRTFQRRHSGANALASL